MMQTFGQIEVGKLFRGGGYVYRKRKLRKHPEAGWVNALRQDGYECHFYDDTEVESLSNDKPAPAIYIEATCADCGNPLSSEDVGAGEEICLECGAALLLDPEGDDPLVARVWVGRSE